MTIEQDEQGPRASCSSSAMLFLSIHPRCPSILFKSKFLIAILDKWLRMYYVPDSAPGMGDGEVKRCRTFLVPRDYHLLWGHGHT